MKKSEIYRMMQYMVLRDHETLSPDKLEILRELMMQEDLAKVLEEKEVKTSEVVGD